MPRSLIALALSMCACSHQATQPLHVVSAFPSVAEISSGWGTVERPIPLYLNSPVKVQFSEPVNPRSVTTDTVRMVKVTATERVRVRMARLVVQTRTVVLHPEVPVTADLDDGSFQPDQLYCLEVEGYPLTNTVRSTTGVGLGARYLRYYRAVPIEHADPGPLLGAAPSEPFRLAASALRIAAESGAIRMQFTLAVDPRSVSPESFAVYVDGNRRLPVESVQIHAASRLISVAPSEADPMQPTMRMSDPGSLLELRVGELGALRPGRPFWVHLRPPAAAGMAPRWVRDYRGRQIEGEGWLSGVISHGNHIELLRIQPRRQGGEPVSEPISRNPALLGFEYSGHRIQVLSREETGNGELGPFHPEQSTILRPNGVMQCADGSYRTVGRTFSFTSIHIPRGVTVSISSADSIEIRSCGHIRIDGELVLMTPRSARPSGQETTSSSSYRHRLGREGFGCRLLAAGDIAIVGAVRHVLVEDPQSSPCTFAARSLLIEGSIPRQSVLAAQVRGVVRGAWFTDALQMTPGLRPAGRREIAEAWTPWQPLPRDYAGSVGARADGVSGDVEVYLQVAPPDPADPSLPYLDPSGRNEPIRLPLRRPLPVGAQYHARFLLRAKVLGGKPLPSLEALVVLGD